jgi:hypothetical protein
MDSNGIDVLVSIFFTKIKVEYEDKKKKNFFCNSSIFKIRFSVLVCLHLYFMSIPLKKCFFGCKTH